MNKLFAVKGFAPYIIMLFLNAFVDLGHKIIIQNTIFKMYDGKTQIILTAIVNALILLPYIFLFTPTAFISDKYPKDSVMRHSALIEVLVVIAVIIAYWQGWFWLAFTLTLLMAIQSAFYSPAKYGYIRELLGDELLAAGNAWVQGATIIAILSGTLVFSALFELALQDKSFSSMGEILRLIFPIGFIILALAVVEFLLSFKLDKKSTTNKALEFNWHEYFQGKSLQNNIVTIKKQPMIIFSIIALLVFWSVSQVVLAIFPAFAKASLGEVNTLVIQAILAATGIGIVLGSITAGALSKLRIELGFLIWGLLGFAILIGVIPLLSSALTMGITFAFIGFFGGIYIVPLNALMQYHAKEQELGLVLAANNWVQNIVMCLALLLTIVLSLLGISSENMFYVFMVLCLGFALLIIKKMPLLLLRLIKPFQQMQVVGFGILPKKTSVLLVSQTLTISDYVLLQLACPHVIKFITNDNNTSIKARLLDISSQVTADQLSAWLNAGFWVYIDESLLSFYQPSLKAQLNISVSLVFCSVDNKKTAQVSFVSPIDF